MNEFWKRFVDECNRVGKSPRQVGIDLGISSSTMTNWKNGHVPRDPVLRKLSAYFGVKTDYFKEDFADSDDELQEYLEALRTRPEMKALFSLAKNATKDDVERAMAIIEALKKNG